MQTLRCAKCGESFTLVIPKVVGDSFFGRCNSEECGAFNRLMPAETMGDGKQLFEVAGFVEQRN